MQRRSMAVRDRYRWGWLEAALLVSVVALILQVLPSEWTGVTRFTEIVISYIDVRNWSWRSYAAVFTGMIFGLMGLKAWLDRDN